MLSIIKICVVSPYYKTEDKLYKEQDIKKFLINKMQSKHIVIQVDIGEGTQWGNDQTINPIREILFLQLGNIAANLIMIIC